MITTNSHNFFLAPLSRSQLTKILKPFLWYIVIMYTYCSMYRSTLAYAVFLTHWSNKVQMTLNDSNFQVNQKKSCSYQEFKLLGVWSKYREKLVFKKLKMTDHLCLQKTKKSKKQTQPRWKIAIFIKSYKEIDQWRLVKYYFIKKVYVLHCRFSGWQTKTKAFPSIG